MSLTFEIVCCLLLAGIFNKLSEIAGSLKTSAKAAAKIDQRMGPG